MNDRTSSGKKIRLAWAAARWNAYLQKKPVAYTEQLNRYSATHAPVSQ